MKILLFVVVAANSLACRGLDHLEEKVPALQYPPEEVMCFKYLKLLCKLLIVFVLTVGTHLAKMHIQV